MEALMQPQADVFERYTAALDRVVEQLQADYYVLAAVLYGSLARGDAWEKSDIDLMIVLRDGQERESRDLWIVEDDINIFAWAVTRNRFKRTLEGELQGSILHSVRSQFKILFTKDESITGWVQESARVEAHDQAFAALRAVSGVIYPLEKAEKWLTKKHDLHYCFMWILFAVNSLARVEVLLNGEAPGREALDQAMQFNPALFRIVYNDLIDCPKTGVALREALGVIDGYLLENRDRLFQPILGYLAEAQGPVTASDLSLHLRKKVQGVTLEGCYEWLARKGIIHKLSSPVHLTRKSQVLLEEAAYYYEASDGSEW
jgi:predicted nucleotidyltransferase